MKIIILVLGSKMRSQPGVRNMCMRRILRDPIMSRHTSEVVATPAQKDSPSSTRVYVRDWRWIGNMFNSYTCASVCSH